jgi:hypothetical protein
LDLEVVQAKLKRTSDAAKFIAGIELAKDAARTV